MSVMMIALYVFALCTLLSLLSAESFFASFSRNKLLKLRAGDDIVPLLADTAAKPLSGLPTSEESPTAADKASLSLQNYGWRGFFRLFTSTESFFEHFIAAFAPDPDINKVLAKFMSYAFWTYLVMCILGTIGIDTKPFMNSLNIGLITLGFAAKDLITNSFAGIFILFTRPFSRGEVITVNGMKGKVTSIDFRYVTLQNEEDNSTTLIPLAMVYGNAIKIQHSVPPTKPSTAPRQETRRDFSDDDQ